MRSFVWLAAWVGVALWSVFCGAAYGVFNLVGGSLARNADLFSSDPQTVEWIFRAFSAIQSLSTGAVLVGWAVVSLMMLAVPWTLDRFARTGRLQATVPTSGRPGWARPDREGVIDLAPDQYSVGPGSPERGVGPNGPAPRIRG